MHIPVPSSAGPLYASVLASSWLFQFSPGSALATASNQHFIASKHTHLSGSCNRCSSSGWVALGLAAQGQQSAGLSTAWPSISSHRTQCKENLILQDVNDVGHAAAAPPAGADISYSPDIELGVNMGKHSPNYVALHVVKPPTIDWLGFKDKVSAAIAVTNKSTNKSSTPPTKAPGWWIVYVKQIKLSPSTAVLGQSS